MYATVSTLVAEYVADTGDVLAMLTAFGIGSSRDEEWWVSVKAHVMRVYCMEERDRTTLVRDGRYTRELMHRVFFPKFTTQSIYTSRAMPHVLKARLMTLISRKCGSRADLREFRLCFDAITARHMRSEELDPFLVTLVMRERIVMDGLEYTPTSTENESVIRRMNDHKLVGLVLGNTAFFIEGV